MFSENLKKYWTIYRSGTALHLSRRQQILYHSCCLLVYITLQIQQSSVRRMRGRVSRAMSLSTFQQCTEIMGLATIEVEI